MKRNKALLTALFALILAGVLVIVGCNTGGGDGDDGISVTGVTLTGSPSIELEEGETGTITAQVQPSTATNKGVTFTSSDTTIVSLTGAANDTKTINALAQGTATITVTTSDGGHTATRSVTVGPPIPLTGLSIVEVNPSVAVNQTITLTVATEPSNASKNFNWTSSSNATATVSNSGVVTGVSQGTAIITATSVKYSDKSANVTVNVTQTQPPPPAGAVTDIHLWQEVGTDGHPKYFEDRTPASTYGVGTVIYPFVVDEIPVGQSRKIYFEVSPKGASSSVTVNALTPEAIATATVSGSEITVTGHSNTVSDGQAMFSVKSVSNPNVIVYFRFQVKPQVKVTKIDLTSEVSDFDLPTISGFNTSTSVGSVSAPVTVAVATDKNKATIVAKLTGDVGKLADLGVHFLYNGSTIIPSALKLNSGKQNFEDQTVEIEIDATSTAAGTFLLEDPNNVAKITVISDLTVAAKADFYLRVIVPLTSVTFSVPSLKAGVDSSFSFTPTPENADTSTILWGIEPDAVWTASGLTASTYLGIKGATATKEVTLEPKLAVAGQDGLGLRVTVKDPLMSASDDGKTHLVNNIKIAAP